MVSALGRDGTARRGAADVDGVALEAARKRKARTYPELAGVHRRARLVVIALEVGGQVVDGDQEFLVPVGQSESSWLNPPHETTNGASVEVEVGINAIVCSRKGSDHLVARVAGCTRRGWRNPNRR